MLNSTQERAIVRLMAQNGGFLGTGFLIAPQIALTCSHVIKDRTSSEVVILGALGGGTPTPIEEFVHHPDPKLDLILIRTTHPNRSEDYVPVERIWPFTGQQVRVYGYTGVAEKVETRPFEVVGSARNGMYKLHGVVPGGFSGSPVLDAEDRVIGMTCLAGDQQSLTYLLPLAEVAAFLDPYLAVPRRSVLDGMEPLLSRPLKAGLSTALGSIHLHVDGGENLGVAQHIIQFTDPEGESSEITQIRDFEKGPQRKALPKLYSEHTPTEAGAERLEFFSTTILHAGPNDPDTKQLCEIEDRTRKVLGELHLQLAQEGAKSGCVVVEAERVVGTVGDDNASSWSSSGPLSSAFDATFLYMKQGQPGLGRTLYEVHFAVDLQRSPGEDGPPLSFEDLLAACARAKLCVGGWFLFESDTKWAFRSNMFEYGFSEEDAKKYQKLLKRELSQLERFDAGAIKIRVLVEEVLGVWNWGEKGFPKINARALSVPELAAWEANIQPGSEFWVATGNFLGDQDHDVRSAMLRNFQKNVRYTYFLQSNPDLSRLSQFRDHLEQHSRTGSLKDTMQAFVVELDKTESWQRKLDCFIATSPDGCVEGYKLTRDTVLNRPITGSLMSPDEIEAVKLLLKRLVPLGSIIGSRHLTPDLFFEGAVVWAGFEYTGLVAKGKLNEEEFAEFQDGYDRELSAEISKFGGEVIYRSGAGYCVVIADLPDKKKTAKCWAFELAAKMQALLEAYDRRLGIEGSHYRFLFSYGDMKRAFRTNGFVPTGSPILECELQAAAFPAGACVALTSFSHPLCEAKSSLLKYMSKRDDGLFDVCLN